MVIYVYLLIDDIIWSVYKLISRTSHPFSMFSNGNMQSLKENPSIKGLNTFKELRKHYRNTFSANQMVIVI